MNFIKRLKHKYLGTEYVWIEDRHGKGANSTSENEWRVGNLDTPASAKGRQVQLERLLQEGPMKAEEQAWSVVVGLGGFAPGDKVYYTNEFLKRFDWPGVVEGVDERGPDDRYFVRFSPIGVMKARLRDVALQEDTLTIPKHRLRMRTE